ncbi:hypothetical protein H0H92_009310 [Tricholoma furcatifolium]|nr:hypothetical protein H0H92_009310 [Tricholoma furcatifolium]
MNGRIELFRLEASRVSLRNNTLPSGHKAALSLRNTRACNSLAFCAADPNYLASGFDKVRGDPSLTIWDINAATATLSVPLGYAANHDVVKRPSPRPQPLLPQADIGGRGADRGIDRIVQQYAPTENVSAVSFLPQYTHQLLAGISNRWLRLFDLRSPASATNTVASRVQGIATDSFDAHRIGSFGEGMISVWDTRKLQVPVLTFSEKDAAGDGASVQSSSIFTGLEFSTTRRGLMASMVKEGTHVRFWNILDADDNVFSDGIKPQDMTRLGKKSWATLPWPSSSASSSNNAPTMKNQEVHPSAVLMDTRKTKNFSWGLSSFALAPSPTQHPLTTNIMVVNKEGDLELHAVYDTPKPAAWSSRGDLAIAAGPSYRIIEASREEDVPDDMLHSTSSLFGHPMGTRGGGSRSREESLMRGREKRPGAVVPPPPLDRHTPLFGRGDEDGFPALGSAGLATARPTPSLSKKTGDALGLSVGREAGGSSTRNTSVSRSRRTSGLKGVAQIVENDISMVMKRRAIRGYGLFDYMKNLDIVQLYDPPQHSRTQMLIDLWNWMSHSHNYLCIPKAVVHGFDFSYQGLFSIWEGLKAILAIQGPNLLATNQYFDLPEQWDSHPSIDEMYGNYSAALGALITRRDRPWKPSIPTAKALHRQVALQLLEWSYREEDFLKDVAEFWLTDFSWEADGEISKVACWLVFTKQHTKAISFLMQSSEESHCMLSGTIAALAPHGSKTPELREHCEWLIVRLQDPYLRAMLTYLASNDWSEVLEEEALPFRERLAIAFMFLDDKAVSSYLRRCQDRAVSRGDIDAIIIPGVSSKAGMDILQGYVNRTGDVQSAAIIGSFVYPPRNPDHIRGISTMERQVGRWVESYRDLLDGFKMFHRRVEFDIERGQIALKDGTAGIGDWVPRQMVIRCNYCNKPVIPDGPGTGIVTVLQAVVEISPIIPINDLDEFFQKGEIEFLDTSAIDKFDQFKRGQLDIEP